MAQINKGTIYSTTNSTVTVDNLNQHVDGATLLPGAIGDQVAILTTADPTTDQVILLASGQLKKATVVQALGGVDPAELLNANNNLSDLASIATAKVNLSLNNVENKSSETIRSEITSANVTSALTYIPTSPSQLNAGLDTRVATSQLGAINGVATLGSDGKLASNQVAALTTASQLALIGTTALPVIGAQPLLSSTTTGTGSVVLSSSPTLTSPTLTSPVLGTPASGDLSNCTNIPLSAVTGTLATTVGGTGQTTYSNGQLLIGNSSGGLSKATLTAGSNVSITNASGSVTVASSIPAATTSQLGGIIPGPGFTISSGQLNAILPKAISSFSGVFADLTTVTASYSKSGSTVTITYDFSGGKPQFYANNKSYFVFTKASGAGTVPVTDIYEITSVTTVGTVQTIITTSGTAGDSAGSVVFRYCKTNSSENFGSIIYTGTTANQGKYLCNFSIQFQNTAFLPVISVSCLTSSSNSADTGARVILLDFNDVTASNTVPRTTSCFTFTSYQFSSGTNKDAGYASSVIVFGS